MKTWDRSEGFDGPAADNRCNNALARGMDRAPSRDAEPGRKPCPPLSDSDSFKNCFTPP